ncbi:hypothetical protein [Myxococcus qinghaiensis]|uniref:hypothetical protein n=1 Tax=Myxococcus qinghaiensis TaxID=2906758 RepID=UPI0020A7B3D3|nr:hypothetical protein [Myxococcus qinghaiensis]MCP3169833.1 hypothetical protein [Myxococcus qinghaiensis]
MSLTIDQQLALKAVLGELGTKVGSRLNLDFDATQSFFDLLRKLTESARGIVKHDYSIALLPTGAGSATLTSATIAASSALNRFTVDFKLRLVQAESASISELDITQRSEQQGIVEVLTATGGYSRIVVQGVLVALWQPSEVSSRRLAATWNRPIEDFGKILNDHIENAIVDERQFEYWADKKNRVLLSGKRGTEHIFHLPLFWWLNTYVNDALKVVGETRGLGQDATDITVVTASGSHVIEVKWLGQNDASTEYKHPPRINEGLTQVGTYLKNDPQLVAGHVVVYDARPSDMHVSNSVHDDGIRPLRCPNPYVVFLASDTPSRSAAKANRPAVASKGSTPSAPKPTTRKAKRPATGPVGAALSVPMPTARKAKRPATIPKGSTSSAPKPTIRKAPRRAPSTPKGRKKKA